MLRLCAHMDAQKLQCINAMKHSIRNPRTGRFIPAPRPQVSELVAAHNSILRLHRLADRLDWITIRLFWAGVGLAIATLAFWSAERGVL